MLLTPAAQPARIASETGEENKMEHMWAPWRIQYIEAEKSDGCILCDKPGEDNDAQNYILFRGDKNFIILNTYPYNPGHLMIAPYRHIARLEELTDEELYEHCQIVSRGVKILREAFNPGGFNVGINMGRAAGAGIEEHIHTHIVPRWHGDTNFVTVMSDVRVIPQALADTYERLRDRF